VVSEVNRLESVARILMKARSQTLHLIIQKDLQYYSLCFPVFTLCGLLEVPLMATKIQMCGYKIVLLSDELKRNQLKGLLLYHQLLLMFEFFIVTIISKSNTLN